MVVVVVVGFLRGRLVVVVDVARSFGRCGETFAEVLLVVVVAGFIARSFGRCEGERLRGLLVMVILIDHGKKKDDAIDVLKVLDGRIVARSFDGRG